MKIVYVHHALRQKNNPPSQDDKIQPLGIKDAEIIAEIMKMMSQQSNNIKAIYTSPYYRCAKTSKIINQYINVPIYNEPRFNELSNTETWKECQIRIRNAIKDIVFKYNDDDIVICVTSGVNITAFISLAFKIQPAETLPFPIVLTCSPIIFKIDKSCF